MLRSRAPSPLRAARTLALAARGLARSCSRPAPRTLLGEHDFRAFTPAETQHHVFRRIVLAAEWERRGDELLFRIEADSFLRHMVRTLVGTMLQTAAGERPPEAFARLLEGAPRAAAGVTAPPHGALPGRRALAGTTTQTERAAFYHPRCRKAVARRQSEMPPQER